MNNEMEQKAYYSILFEYYKALLTEKQINVFISYYNDDYSLAEIAEAENVSRNAVWDNLKKTINLLDKYENSLGLYKKDRLLSDALENLKKHTDEDGKKIINQILEME